VAVSPFQTKYSRRLPIQLGNDKGVAVEKGTKAIISANFRARGERTFARKRVLPGRKQQGVNLEMCLQRLEFAGGS
jgi:hypothetical protein